MPTEFSSLFFTFWTVFSFSFLVALTGAMSPGPLLTYTIIKSVESEDRGYLMGLWIIIGHAIIEMAIVIVLLLGLSFLFKNIYVVRTIGIAGGVILSIFGISIIRDVYLGKISPAFLNSAEQISQDRGSVSKKSLKNPIIGGILVSMSNPYWWVWWGTIGLGFMLQFDITFRQWPRLLAFFIGHEAGDLLWYLIVSFISFFSLKYLNRKVYYSILVCCGVFMILFGTFLALSPFLKKGIV